ncbi:hypothetical protein DZJ_30630 [Dickeya ananatis]
MVLYAERSHYSLAKACRVLQLATPAQAGPALGRCPINAGVWPQALPCDDAGRVDVESLLQLVTFFSSLPTASDYLPDQWDDV